MGKISKGVLIVALLVLGGFWVWKTFNVTAKKIKEETPELTIMANDLIATAQVDQSLFSDAYADKVLEVKGKILEINHLNNRTTVILEGEGKNGPTVICDLIKGQTETITGFNVADTVVVKGIYKGFLKDAIFLNCIISHEPNP